MRSIRVVSRPITALVARPIIELPGAIFGSYDGNRNSAVTAEPTVI